MRVDFSDILAILGLALMAAGLVLIDYRLALVVVGAILLAVGIAGAMRATPKGK